MNERVTLRMVAGWIKKFLLFIAKIILLAVALIMLYAIKKTLFLPEDMLLYSEGEFTKDLIFGVTSVLFVCSHPVRALKSCWVREKRKERRKVALEFLLFGICLYGYMTDITYVKEEKIVVRSFLHPAAATYSYDDVTEIECGFGTKTFGRIFMKSRDIKNSYQEGEFYYWVKAGGRWIDLTNAEDNSEEWVSAGSLLGEVDSALTKRGVTKQCHTEGEKYFDEYEISRYLDIVETDESVTKEKNESN